MFFFFCFAFEKISSELPLLLVMLFDHVGKRSNSSSQMFLKTDVLKSFAIFTGKRMCWSLFLIKLQDWRPVFLFKETLTQVFFCEYCEIFKNSFFTGTPSHYTFLKFYLMIDIWYVNSPPRIFLLLNHFAFAEICR